MTFFWMIEKKISTLCGYPHKIDYAELVVMLSGSGVAQCRPARGG
jgi:hypothetical protein